MREMTPDEVKKTQLEILDYVAEFCDTHQIKYWLDSGTLLGAVRHKGYIPWDDDIDVGMLRPDFDRLMTLFDGGENTRYQFICGENSKDFFTAHGKVMDVTTILYEPDLKGYKSAVNIDIFVYDNAPDEDTLVKRMFDRRDIYRTLGAFQFRTIQKKEGDGCLKAAAKVILNCVCTFSPKGYFTQKMIHNAKLYSKEKGLERIGNFTSYSRTVCNIHAFDETIPIEFEGKVYKAPRGWDEWLTAMYGAYMELPPVEKRVTHHSYIAYTDI